MDWTGGEQERTTIRSTCGSDYTTVLYCTVLVKSTNLKFSLNKIN